MRSVVTSSRNVKPAKFFASPDPEESSNEVFEEIEKLKQKNLLLEEHNKNLETKVSDLEVRIESLYRDKEDLEILLAVGDRDLEKSWRESISERRFMDTPGDLVRVRSELLSAFYGREVMMEASVLAPADWDGEEALPVCYIVHGFGGDNWGVFQQAKTWREKIARSFAPSSLWRTNSRGGALRKDLPVAQTYSASRVLVFP